MSRFGVFALVAVLAALASPLFLSPLGLSEARIARAPGGVETSRPVVVELFTSQGCHSCPPADALLGELKGRDDVLALSFHVDYWDYLGWRDPFASPAHTARQKSYAKRLPRRIAYTPQIVIDGRFDAVGSDRRRVTRAIDDAARLRMTIDMAFDADTGQLAMAAASDMRKRATVWLVAYDREQSTSIRRGENAGKRLTYHNVVRLYERIGRWDGDATSFAVDLDAAAGHDGLAVLVQENETGPVIGAFHMAL